MRRYTMHVDATFAFDVDASSEAEAMGKARELLASEVMEDSGVFVRGLLAPWVSVAGATTGDLETLEAVDVFEAP